MFMGVHGCGVGVGSGCDGCGGGCGRGGVGVACCGCGLICFVFWGCSFSVDSPFPSSHLSRFTICFCFLLCSGQPEFYYADDSGDQTYLRQLQNHCAASEQIELKVGQ